MPQTITDVTALHVDVRGVGRRFPFPDGSEHVVLRDIDLSICCRR